MTKRILVLGAGLVVRPLINYLLAKEDVELNLVDLDKSRAEKLIAGHLRGKAIGTDKNSSNFPELIENSDIVISLLPAHLHVPVAKLCLKYSKHMVTASYISKEMKALHSEAEKAGLLFLNEMGLDPGIDHMSAMKIIHEIRENGGHVSSFRSICGGIPAPEAANNPFKYKFSWSPIGVLKALKSNAKYLDNNTVKEINENQLMGISVNDTIVGYGPIEVYPNRNSIDYVDIYGIEKSTYVLRGTIRNPGWSVIIDKIKKINYLSEDNFPSNINTYATLTNYLLEKTGASSLKEFCASDDVFHAFQWLGLESKIEIPEHCKNPILALTHIMKSKMGYADGERDMLILQHEFEATYEDNSTKKIRSLLIEYGISYGDSGMARTVSLPPAIAALMILEGKISARGVQIPIHRDIYMPVLAELEKLGIAFKETWN
ncbi:MAG: saccharopine dehydrogenase NADP-binding domain-containing protein [Candidatus Marinimicrobia bacterium]|nr:saccharopine dehydrogenase NADP-binding domain-containing protein [Candidatus Neomarinimicrobiota bacterium]